MEKQNGSSVYLITNQKTAVWILEPFENLDQARQAYPDKKYTIRPFPKEDNRAQAKKG